MVIPVFDAGETLPETLASVRAQTRPADELILVDDGSADARTLALLRELEACPGTPPLRVVRQPNQGLFAARNAGIAAAGSELVLPLDADDLLLPTCLAELESALARAPSASFSHCQVESFGADAFVDALPPFNPFLELDENLLVATALLRRSLFTDDACWYPALPSFEDWGFWLSLVAKGRTGVLVEQPLFRYRRQRTRGLLSSANLRRPELTARVQALHPAIHRPDGRAALKALHAPGFELFGWGVQAPGKLVDSLSLQTLDDVLVTTGDEATRAISSPEALLRSARGRFVCAADTSALGACAQVPTLLADVALAFELEPARAVVEAHSVRFLRLAAAADLRPREVPANLDALFELFGPGGRTPPNARPFATVSSPLRAAWRGARSLAESLVGPERVARALQPVKVRLTERVRRAARDARALSDLIDPPLLSASRRREIELRERVPVRLSRRAALRDLP